MNKTCPLIRLWKKGDLHRVDAFLDDCGLREQGLFRRVLPSLTDRAEEGSEEQGILESIGTLCGSEASERPAEAVENRETP